MSNELRRVRCHYTGRVQGVGFRETARRAIARVPGVTGYVRNLPDGRVELVAEGPPAAIESALAAVARQMAGQVDGVAQTESPATGEFDDFVVRR